MLVGQKTSCFAGPRCLQVQSRRRRLSLGVDQMSEEIESIAREFDHYDRESANCPWPRWERLRNEAPVAWSEKNGGFWVISSYDFITEALRDTETFSNHLKGVTIPTKPVPRLPPSEFDGTAHTAYRR